MYLCEIGLLIILHFHLSQTIARLISRFYDPDEGSVCIDGRDLRELDVTSMRDHVGLVSQEPLLFDDTIAENIARGKPGTEHATMDEIIAAAKAANAYDFIQAFPEGFETKVGARGGKLSGGQKQPIGECLCCLAFASSYVVY